MRDKELALEILRQIKDAAEKTIIGIVATKALPIPAFLLSLPDAV